MLKSPASWGKICPSQKRLHRPPQLHYKVNLLKMRNFNRSSKLNSLSLALAVLFLCQCLCLPSFASEGSKQAVQVSETALKVAKKQDRDCAPESAESVAKESEEEDSEDVGNEEFSRAEEEEGEDSNVSSDTTVFKKDDGKPVVALALGGGGGRGSAHVGVLKVLIKEKIPFDMVVGTSIGSIVGGFYAAGVPIEKIEEMFTDCSLMKSFMTVSLKTRMVAAPIMITPRLLGRHPYDGLYYGNKFRKYLLRQLPADKRKIENLPKKYAAIAVDLMSGEVTPLTKGNIGYAMQASSAVPGLRKPVEIDNRLYVDGGISENVPVAQAKKLGADVVIAVNIDEYLKELPLEHFRHVGSVSKRIVTLQLRNLDKPMADQACVTIHPDVTGIGLLSTDKDDATNGIAAGEKAAQEKLPEIKKCLRDAGVDI